MTNAILFIVVSMSVGTVAEDLLPLLTTEKTIFSFEGGERPVPCCALAPPDCINFLIHPGGHWLDFKQEHFCCTFEGTFRLLSFFFVELITLGCRPIMKNPQAVLTSNTVFYVAADETRKNCWATALGCHNMDRFTLVWVPVRALRGYSNAVATHGSHAAQGCLCGICCELPNHRGASEYRLTLRTDKGFSLPLNVNVPEKNWVLDNRLNKLQAVVGALHHAVRREQMDQRA